MFCSFYLTPFIITNVVYHFLFPFLNAIPSGDDLMLIAFMKGHQEKQLSEYSMEKYQAYLGIMFYMRKNCKCDKIDVKFEGFERTECQKYRKYLDILYEYLFREYIAIPTVKPKFAFKERIEIKGPIIYVVNCLVRISQFYFNSKWSKIYKYKLNKLFINKFEPKLLYEERLNYEFKLENESKMPINEMILQLAIETANEWPKDGILDGIIREFFDQNLQEIFKRADERAKYDDKHLIIVRSKFDNYLKWTEDALFSEFVKGLATNLEKFFKMAKEYSNYLCRMNELGKFYVNDRLIIPFGLYEFEKVKEFLTRKFEAYLGVMYLKRENWHFDKIDVKFEEYERTECQKYRKYLEILYEYLFRLYAEPKNPNVSKQLPPLVKPIFLMGEKYQRSLTGVIITLNEISKCFWLKDENELKNANYIREMDLVNEDELIKAKDGENASKNETETNIAELRKEFEELMKIQCEKAKENAKEAKEKLDKAKSGTEDDEEKELEEEYDDKFGIFNSSPFS